MMEFQLQVSYPYDSISVTFSNGRMAVWESHIHGNQTPESVLVAMSLLFTTPEIWQTICLFLFRQFNFQLEDAQV